ncbi:MAG TPA: hypothetical protein VK436_11950 [Methanocella sp.]|nr:hypothetical protein [Methanocella sp.]
MKITSDALEIAKASAKDSEVPLILVGEKGVITDVMISPDQIAFDTSARQMVNMLPAGVRRYGKVITKNDQDLEPGYNLIEENNAWKFVDEDGKDTTVQVIDSGEDQGADKNVLSDLEAEGARNSDESE